MAKESIAGLILEVSCQACEGCGVVADPAWLAWHKQHNLWLGEHLGQYGEFNKLTPEPDGPEEYPCRACNGTGKVLTPDGQSVADLVYKIMAEKLGEEEQRKERERQAQSDRDYSQELATERRERRNRALAADLEEGLRRERWAREDLEAKLNRGR